ncbi:MAG TPA: DUF6481 family protein, partial [Alphaproteobacteria bacterium]|nr:DUF6481 family protein [Alphaproteobacteria bacterium]
MAGSFCWGDRHLAGPDPTNRRYMKAFKGRDFDERLNSAADARKAMQQRALARINAEDPAQRAARAAAAAAKDARQAEKAAAKRAAQ